MREVIEFILAFEESVEQEFILIGEVFDDVEVWDVGCFGRGEIIFGAEQQPVEVDIEFLGEGGDGLERGKIGASFDGRERRGSDAEILGERFLSFLQIIASLNKPLTNRCFQYFFHFFLTKSGQNIFFLLTAKISDQLLTHRD